MQRLASSVAALRTPDRGKESLGRPTTTRVCTDPECSTILSSYNDTSACWIHRDRSYQRNTFRP
jgi:hypothetical protein